MSDLSIAQKLLQQVKDGFAEQALEYPQDIATTEHLARVWMASDYAVWVASRYPQLVKELLQGDDLLKPRQLGEQVKLLNIYLDECDDEPQLMERLRCYRHQQLFRIMYRDLNALADLKETMADISQLADASINAALDHLYAWHCKRWGQPKEHGGQVQQLIVLGLGKLGGSELNFSSDVDLIFTISDQSDSDAPTPQENILFFTRLAQQLIRVLNEATKDGFVYRVDTRLRPFGESGPLVVSQAALENYLLTQGREWERYAMIKARVVAGDQQAGRSTLAALRPFVYRRYLDYGAFDALRDMKQKISQEVIRRGLSMDIKLGVGGIREIEFIAQAFQLIRGGREPALQQRELLLVLDELQQQNLLDTETIAELICAYHFLRRLENRLQMFADEQIHRLPAEPERQLRLTHAMGYSDWGQLLRAWEAHKFQVNKHFENVFQIPENKKNVSNEYSPVWQQAQEPEKSIQLLTDAGYKNASAVMARLYNLKEGGFYTTLTTTGRKRLNRIVPKVLLVCAGKNDPDKVLSRVLKFIQSISGRSVYLSLLNEKPDALQRLVDLFAASQWMAEYLTLHPILLDDLLNEEEASNQPDAGMLAQWLHEELIKLPALDIEAHLDAMRNFKHSQVFRIAVAELGGHLPLMKASDQLTWLAEAMVNEVYQLVWNEMIQRYGQPTAVLNGEIYYPDVIVVAYGKLAGLELGFDSDLDLVFVHNSEGNLQNTNGHQSIDNATFFTRFAQRIINYLNSRTAAGILYEIDTRLRPNGRAGLLVSSIAAFKQYQTEAAWTWEHQALVRTRVVAGQTELCEQFDQLRNQILTRDRDESKLKQDVREMALKMRAELMNYKLESLLKYGPGGITAIEFMVQYHVLRSAKAVPELLAVTDNIRQLEALTKHKLVPQEMANELITAYKGLREYLHRLALRGDTKETIDKACAGYQKSVDKWWQMQMLS